MEVIFIPVPVPPRPEGTVTITMTESQAKALRAFFGGLSPGAIRPILEFAYHKADASEVWKITDQAYGLISQVLKT